MPHETLSPYEQWMVRSNLETIRTTDVSAVEIIATLRANGYPRVAEEVGAQFAQTREEARQHAIDWQHWMSEQSLSWGELIEWQGHFEALAERFDLTDEFKENGVL